MGLAQVHPNYGLKQITVYVCGIISESNNWRITLKVKLVSILIGDQFCQNPPLMHCYGKEQFSLSMDGSINTLITSTPLPNVDGSVFAKAVS